ncbi:MAG: hypothetical protein AAGF92_24670 [Myxococcota bacterium]
MEEASDFDLEGWRNALLIEASDANERFSQVIYSLRHDDPTVAVDELYRRARLLLRSLVTDGLLSVVEVQCRDTDRAGYREVVHEDALPLEAALKMIDNPEVYDRDHTAAHRFYELATTSQGERYLDQLQRSS